MPLDHALDLYLQNEKQHIKVEDRDEMVFGINANNRKRKQKLKHKQQ